MRQQQILGILIFLLGTTVPVACVQSDRHLLSDRTRHKLSQLSTLVVALDKSGHDIRAIASLPDMLEKASLAGYLPDDQYESRQFESDGWGRPFEWTVLEAGKETIVEMKSYGRNGTDDQGEGDDLCVTIRVGKGTG